MNTHPLLDEMYHVADEEKDEQKRALKFQKLSQLLFALLSELLDESDCEIVFIDHDAPTKEGLN